MHPWVLRGWVGITFLHFPCLIFGLSIVSCRLFFAELQMCARREHTLPAPSGRFDEDASLIAIELLMLLRRSPRTSPRTPLVPRRLAILVVCVAPLVALELALDLSLAGRGEQLAPAAVENAPVVAVQAHVVRRLHGRDAGGAALREVEHGLWIRGPLLAAVADSPSPMTRTPAFPWS